MKYKIFIPKNSGYCMGVKNAFKGSYEISEKYKGVVLYGEMVHNRFALKTLLDKKIRIINKIEDILNDKQIKNVIIRAHGIPPSEENDLRQNCKKIFDMTCPNVKKVQLLTKKLTEDGYKIIIFGKINHPEVTGIKGYSLNGNYHVVKEINDIESILYDNEDKIALISQTTMNSDDFDSISKKLKEKFNNLEVFNTLCKSPIKTQNEAIALAKKVDIMIVVGDKMSANNATLYEKIKEHSKVIFAETQYDIDFTELKKYKKIGITGGSSTPDWQIENIQKLISKTLN